MQILSGLSLPARIPTSPCQWLPEGRLLSRQWLLFWQNLPWWSLCQSLFSTQRLWTQCPVQRQGPPSTMYLPLWLHWQPICEMYPRQGWLPVQPLWSKCPLHRPCWHFWVQMWGRVHRESNQTRWRMHLSSNINRRVQDKGLRSKCWVQVCPRSGSMLLPDQVSTWQSGSWMFQLTWRFEIFPFLTKNFHWTKIFHKISQKD
jgi:hypothetical protein